MKEENQDGSHPIATRLIVTRDELGTIRFDAGEFNHLELFGLARLMERHADSGIETTTTPAPKARGEASEPQHKTPVTSQLPPVQQGGDNAR